MSRDPVLFLEDVERACTNIISYTRGHARDQVFCDQMRLDAVLMNFQIIGEAVKRLSVETRDEYPSIPWRRIAGMRNVVADAYYALDLDIVWDAICVDVPELQEQIRGMIAAELGSRTS